MKAAAVIKSLIRTTSILGLIAASGCASPPLIRPGAAWLDNRGKQIQSHGGGVIKLGEAYYWFGEDRSRDNDPNYRYVACYSSADLAHWKFRRQVIKLSDPEQLGHNWVLERPKVFYNTKTKKFVMYAHMDGKGGYKFARVAVFTCDKVDGDYQYLKNFRPLGHESRDIGQFIDDDGTAYLIFEDRPFGFRIAKLSDDYLTVEKQMCLIPEHLEGGAVEKTRAMNLWSALTMYRGSSRGAKSAAPAPVASRIAESAGALEEATAVARGCDIDKPRNLAKSVTVE